MLLRVAKVDKNISYSISHHKFFFSMVISLPLAFMDQLLTVDWCFFLMTIFFLNLDTELTLKIL